MKGIKSDSDEEAWDKKTMKLKLKQQWQDKECLVMCWQ